MYKVQVSFVTNDLAGTIGSVIHIDDEELADSLKEVGYIKPVSKKEQTEINKDIIINELEKENNELKTENDNLTKQLEELSILLENETSSKDETDEINKENDEVIEDDSTGEFIKEEDGNNENLENN